MFRATVVTRVGTVEIERCIEVENVNQLTTEERRILVTLVDEPIPSKKKDIDKISEVLSASAGRKEE